MGKISNADARAFLATMFGGATFPTPPSTYYVGLSITQPGDDGSNITEPSGGGYARASIPNNSSSWALGTAPARNATNSVAVVFPAATADWTASGQMVGYFVIMDASTGGTMRAWGSLTAPQAITADVSTPPTFPVGALVVTAPGS